MSAFQKKWVRYLQTRTASYQQRTVRYRAVLDKLLDLGLKDGMRVMDLGAGEAQFGKYIEQRGLDIAYIPVDAVIGGVDLDSWTPESRPHFMTVIEVVEHLRFPSRIAGMTPFWVEKGVVATTPNPDVVDVLNCDPTHTCACPDWWWKFYNWEVNPISLFGRKDDSLIAWYDKTRSLLGRSRS